MDSSALRLASSVLTGNGSTATAPITRSPPRPRGDPDPSHSGPRTARHPGARTMPTIMRDERGQLVHATDGLGTYYFLADNSGKPAAGGWTQLGDAESAWESFVAEDAIYPH